jgi:hypothetical protein
MSMTEALVTRELGYNEVIHPGAYEIWRLPLFAETSMK